MCHCPCPTLCGHSVVCGSVFASNFKAGAGNRCSESLGGSDSFIFPFEWGQKQDEGVARVLGVRIFGILCTEYCHGRP